MPVLVDFVERALSGPLMSDREFNMKVLMPTIKEVVKEYDIRYDSRDPFMRDDETADRLYRGACDLLSRTGIYCEDTNRVIEVGAEEIEQSVRNFSPSGIFGEGRERKIFLPRKPQDPALPWFHVGTGIVASSEDIALAQVEGYGSIEEADSISIPAFAQVRGMKVPGGSPLEILAAVSSVKAGRKALARCGRPGLPIMNLISSATSSVGTIAGTHPLFGLRPSDGWLIDIIAEMKLNFENLNRLVFVLTTGGNVGSTGLPVLGGYAGGAEGTALVMAAYYLIGMLVFRGTYHLTGPVHFRHGCSTTRDCLWVFSIVGRAMARNTRYPAIGLGYASAGPFTRMYFHEAAAVNLAMVASGYGGVQTVHPARAVVNDGVTPLEARFNVEAARAAAGMGSGRAGEIVMKLLEKYEKKIERAPEGKRYAECCHLPAGKPRDEYIGLYEEIKEDMQTLGIPWD